MSGLIMVEAATVTQDVVVKVDTPVVVMVMMVRYRTRDGSHGSGKA